MLRQPKEWRLSHQQKPLISAVRLSAFVSGRMRQSPVRLEASQLYLKEIIFLEYERSPILGPSQEGQSASYRRDDAPVCADYGDIALVSQSGSASASRQDQISRGGADIRPIASTPGNPADGTYPSCGK